jgi:hypothetical protein
MYHPENQKLKSKEYLTDCVDARVCLGKSQNCG